MNKVNDCFLLLNESISISHANSFENSSNLSNKSKNLQKNGNGNNHRNSPVSQTSGNAGAPNKATNSSSLRIIKLLQRFLNYDKLNMLVGGFQGI